MAMVPGHVTIDDDGNIVGGSNGLALNIYNDMIALHPQQLGTAGNRRWFGWLSTAVATAVVQHIQANAVVSGSSVT